MKKLASILGIGVISMAVALAPALAQQTKPPEPAGSATVQPKSDVKAPTNQTGKDEKNLPGKPGSDTKSVPDTKATAPVPSATPKGDVKIDKDKSAPAKSGTDVKSEAVPGPDTKATAPASSTKKTDDVKTDKSATDVKAGTASPKTDSGAKDQKGSNVKPGANMKNDQPSKSDIHSKAVATPKHLVKKSSRNPASQMHAKACASNPQNCKTTVK